MRSPPKPNLVSSMPRRNHSTILETGSDPTTETFSPDSTLLCVNLAGRHRLAGDELLDGGLDLSS